MFIKLENKAIIF